jgi:hypothetical protein
VTSSAVTPFSWFRAIRSTSITQRSKGRKAASRSPRSLLGGRWCNKIGCKSRSSASATTGTALLPLDGEEKKVFGTSYCFPSRRQRFQFTLRSLFAGMLICALIFTWLRPSQINATFTALPVTNSTSCHFRLTNVGRESLWYLAEYWVDEPVLFVPPRRGSGWAMSLGSCSGKQWVELRPGRCVQGTVLASTIAHDMRIGMYVARDRDGRDEQLVWSKRAPTSRRVLFYSDRLDGEAGSSAGAPPPTPSPASPLRLRLRGAGQASVGQRWNGSCQH